MTLDAVIQEIINSYADDWSIFEWGPFYRNHFEVELDAHGSLFALRTNVSISIACGAYKDRSWEEEWHKVFPDPKASARYVDILWNAAPIHREIGISVDGARCLLPMPRKQASQVALREVEFFERVNDLTGGTRTGRVGHGVRGYLSQANIEIVDETWPRPGRG